MTLAVSRPARLINAGVSLTSTNQTTVYTVPANHGAVFKRIIIAETSGNATGITLELTDASASATYKMLSAKSVGANDYLLLDLELNLNESDVIKLTAATANRLQAVLSIDEIFLANNSYASYELFRINKSCFI